MPNPELPRPFGPYTLHRRLAAGGMAEVYLASVQSTAGFEKPVAIKRIHPSRVDDGDPGAALVDEAKLSVVLTHPNIVQTLDLGSVEGAYFIVMEHVEGFDAQQVLDALRARAQHVPVDLAAYVIAELCRGLDFAHRSRNEIGEPRDIVHRDVSPQNVLLSFAGEVKLADFGIAMSTERQSDPESRVIKGKYFYMSPEQARAEPLDRRSDIYSAGVVLWELLVGRRLHQAQDVQSLLDAVRRADVPEPSSVRPEVPPALDAVVARATAREPEHRFRSAAEMVDALSDYLADRPAVHGPQEISQLLAGLPSSEPRASAPPAHRVPLTRDRAATRSGAQVWTPPEPPLRYELDAGRATVAGWKSPGRPAPRCSWLLALLAGSLVVALAAWLLHGA